MKLQHQNVENVEQFDKVQAEILRQKKMQYLLDDVNYQLGFNHAWVAMQGASREAVIDASVKKKLEQRVKQLEAECSTLEAELVAIKRSPPDGMLSPVVDPQVQPDVPRGTTDAAPPADVPRGTPKPKVTRRASTAKPKPTAQ